MSPRNGGIPVLLVLGFAGFAGCFGAGDKDTLTPAATSPTAPELPELVAGRGAITGLLVDDRFRPIPDGLILLQEAGTTARSNADGVFSFADVKPGRYTLRVDVDGHEAAPREVEVKGGEYAEAEVIARRVVSEGGTILTQEFTVFVPCAADFGATGLIWSCIPDLSGDTYRPGFTSNYTTMENVTYFVTEMKANQVGRYTVSVREDDGSPGGGIRYAAARVVDTDYVKIVNAFNVTNEEHNEGGRNVPWLNDRPFETLLFYEGQYRDEISSVGETTCHPEVSGYTCLRRGVGASFGIKARFVQSLFIGPPEVDLATYRTMQ